MSNNSKPTIETMINTAALALTSFGVIVITKSDLMSWSEMIKGMVLICFGAGLEYIKYSGRKKKLWGC